jgi:hypothetical protein
MEIKMNIINIIKRHFFRMIKSIRMAFFVVKETQESPDSINNAFEEHRGCKNQETALYNLTAGGCILLLSYGTDQGFEYCEKDII